MLISLLSSAVYSCSVPVFRYALERWQADRYFIKIVHQQSLNAEAEEAIELLENYAKADGPSANLIVRRVSEGEDAEKDNDLSQQPQMIVHFPRTARNPTPIRTAPLTVEAVKKIVDSPVRRELIKRLIGGDSVVWILLESGDEQKDDTAAETIQEQLTFLQKTLKLPAEQMAWEDGSPFTPDKASGLKLKFSMIRLKRDDLGEKFLIDSLLRTERDLLQFNEPMVFPVFGRGVVLCAFVGEGISERNITYGCYFLTGPCSCQIKQQNPGVDLLLKADWSVVFQSQSAIAEPVSPYVVVVDTNEPNEIPSIAEPNTALKQPSTTSLTKRILLVFVMGLIIVVIGSAAVHRNQKTNLQSREESEK